MDLGVIITACIGIVTTFFSSLITRIFTKRKYNAEVDTTTIENIKASLKVYQDMVRDLGRKLDIYGKIIDKNKGDLIRLKNVVIKMMGKICTVESCKNRCPYTDAEIEDLLKVLDFDVDDSEYKAEHKAEFNEINS